jgi:hypothetical protein
MNVLSDNESLVVDVLTSVMIYVMFYNSNFLSVIYIFSSMLSIISFYLINPLP